MQATVGSVFTRQLTGTSVDTVVMVTTVVVDVMMLPISRSWRSRSPSGGGRQRWGGSNEVAQERGSRGGGGGAVGATCPHNLEAVGAPPPNFGLSMSFIFFVFFCT